MATVASPPLPASENDLVRQARGGDAEAFAGLVALHRDAVLRACLARVRDAETAEDLAQEAFLRAWVNLDRLKAPYSFGPWVGRIARNLAASRLRDESRRKAHLRRDHAADLTLVADRAGADRTHRSTVRRDIERVLATLPPASRELVRLHFEEGHTRAEIAARMGVHPSTVGRQLDRALAEMRASLATAPAGARRTVALLAAISAVSFSAPARAASVPYTPPPGMLTLLLQGIGIMGTKAKLAAAAAAVAVVAGGVYLTSRPDTSPVHGNLPAAVAATVGRADDQGVLPHTLGTESVFTLEDGGKVVLDPGANTFNLRDISVAREDGHLAVQVAFADGTTQVFRGTLASADFVMLGATNYVEEGSVEGTATQPPPGLMTYLTWQPEGAAMRFRVHTKANEQFGRALQDLGRRVETGRLSTGDAVAEGTRLMRVHSMYPSGEAWRRAGAGFIP